MDTPVFDASRPIALRLPGPNGGRTIRVRYPTDEEWVERQDEAETDAFGAVKLIEELATCDVDDVVASGEGFPLRAGSDVRFEAGSADFADRDRRR